MRSIVTCLALAAGLVAFTDAASAQAPKPIRFMLDWKLQGPNGPFFLADDKGYFAAEGIKIQLDAGEGSSAPPSRIASGVYDAGFGDINAQMEFGVKNPAVPMRTVYMMYNRSPLVAVWMKSKGYTKPTDLAGKSLGAPNFDAGYRLFPAFAKAVGIDPAGIKWTNMAPNLREPLLIKGEVDAITGFDSSVVFALKTLNVKLEDVAITYYADHGVDIYSNGIIVSKALLDGQPEVARGLIRAINKGWIDTLSNPAAAVDAVVKRDALLNRDIEMERLNWVLTNQVLTAETAEFGLGAVKADRLAKSIDIVSAAFGLATKPAPGDVFDASFLPPLDQRRTPKPKS